MRVSACCHIANAFVRFHECMYCASRSFCLSHMTYDIMHDNSRAIYPQYLFCDRRRFINRLDVVDVIDVVDVVDDLVSSNVKNLLKNLCHNYINRETYSGCRSFKTYVPMCSLQQKLVKRM